MTLVSSAFSSCTEDPCEGVSCLNGGMCSNGTCECDAGYEGLDCGTQMRTKMLGTYSVTEVCTSGQATYDMSISTSAYGVDKVIISNFAGLGITANGTVHDKSITVTPGTADVQGTLMAYEGTGQISGNVLTLDYTVVGGVVDDSCVATCTKQ